MIVVIAPVSEIRLPGLFLSYIFTVIVSAFLCNLTKAAVSLTLLRKRLFISNHISLNLFLQSLKALKYISVYLIVPLIFGSYQIQFSVSSHNVRLSFRLSSFVCAFSTINFHFLLHLKFLSQSQS